MHAWEIASPLIASLYEASVHPSKWATVLTEICVATDFDLGVMFSSDGENENRVATPDGEVLLTKFVEGGWLARNERMVRMFALGRHGFVRDLDVFEPDEIPRIPVYRDFLHPEGLGHGAATFVESPGENRMVLSLERRLVRGPAGDGSVAVLDLLRPHLARAVMLTIEVGRMRTELTLSTLSSVGIAAAVVAADAGLVGANPLFEALDGQIAMRSLDRFRLRDARSDRMLRDALARIGTDDGGEVRSIPLPATQTDPPCVVHLLPLRREARDLGSRGAAVLFVSKSETDGEVPHALLRGLYDLTSGEAKVAACILEGLGLREAAVRLGIGYETARSFAKGVFAKTGSAGQTDLVRRTAFLQRT